ncbi:hypothetical protein H4P12_08490 [Paracoccus sp. 11-3]|uniref:Uncharacterized protein n=1 Tax=Paracoccus amoyensis TaxID=2760093 RepID=A0A926GG91_9RHOB|nr:hypothetical protein [Paracoccus amoyensis]MBC9246749.1 hypothetical protein [Paracoccus amoyensis]
MRVFDPVTAAYFASRKPFMGHVLVWIRARHRISGDSETIGFWTGADHHEFVIEGQTRLYFGAGAYLKMDPIRRQTGLRVRTQRITISQIAPEAQMLIRGYEPRHAPVEVHRALFDPLTENLIAEPHVILRGFLDKAPLTTPPKGEAGEATLEIVTEGRALTKPLSRFRSHATLRTRAPTDGFRRFAARSKTEEVKWGR